MVDQRKLPADEIYVTCKNVNDVAKAIKTMVIRGADFEARKIRHGVGARVTGGGDEPIRGGQ